MRIKAPSLASLTFAVMDSIRVALDATPLTIPTGGVRRYVEQLHRALSLNFPQDHYELLSDQIGERPAGLNRRWWLLGLGRTLDARNLQVFHGTDFAVPYLRRHPAVMTVHDLSPWHAEFGCYSSARVRRRTPLLLRYGRASMVITPSEAVRREAIEHFALNPQRVVAIPLAAHEMFAPVETGARPRPYFLYVGTVERRKNLRVVVDAWRDIRRTTDVDLVVAGRLRDTMNLDQVVVLGPVEENALPALYSGALAAVYPSRYEGFGLPVLEAMQCGAMTITSHDAAITEVAGGAALQVDAHDTAGWMAAMRSALSAETRSLWRERGLRRARDFSWQRTATLTREVYIEALRRG